MVNKFRLNAVHFVAYGAGISLIILSLVFAFVMFQPVQVVTQWTLQTNDGPTYHSGDNITLTSTLVKKMNVSGESHRYVVCTTIAGNEERFTISTAEANRPAGSRSTELMIQLPQGITGLPKTCHVTITIVYNIYGGIRNDVVSVDSNNFTIVP